jgi:hypothetical protein
MYTACIFCHAALGDNDRIEHFPVGRRLAFDSAKGRLWAVCQKCAQWNLTPIEERWEAVEECERAYRSVRTRVSTSEIGLARLPDGLDLIRIGAPLRPEFAAWRFGDQLGLRRRRSLRRLLGGSSIAAGTAASVASAAGVVALGLIGPGLIVGGAIVAATGVRPPAGRSGIRGVRVRAENNEVIELSSRPLIGIEMRSDVGPTPFKLSLTYMDTDPDMPENGPMTTQATVSGQEAVRAARILLPRINASGATRRVVQEAVDGIENAGSVERFIPKAMELLRKSGLAYSPVWSYPQPVRLGLEMALHEEAEWRAMEGELAELEAAWREAERVAGIADNLVLPPHVNVFMDKYRKRP